MAELFSWLSGAEAERDQSHKKSQEPPADAYVTQKEMMDALMKLQNRIEDRFRAERNKRAQRFQKLNEDVARRFAEVEGNLLYEVQEQQQQLALPPTRGTANPAGPTPADVERLAQSLAQREPRLAALVGETPTVHSTALFASSGFDDTTKMASGIPDSGSKITLLEQLSSKVERLDRGFKALVVSAAETVKSRRPDSMITQGGGVPEAKSVGGASNVSGWSGWSEPTGVAEQVLTWTTKLDNFESDMQFASRRITDVEVKMKAFEQQLDGRVQASIKKVLTSLVLDRGR